MNHNNNVHFTVYFSISASTHLKTYTQYINTTRLPFNGTHTTRELHAQTRCNLDLDLIILI